jgi:hypothetical protein
MNGFPLFASGGADAGRAESDLSDRSDGPLHSGRRQPAVYAYSDDYLVDLKHAVILDVEATMSIRQAEVSAAKTMLDRTGGTVGVSPRPVFSPMQAMAQLRCWDGWWTSAGSSRA